MPQPNVRHADTGWEWGPNPSRGEITRRATADDPEPARRPPGRKNTRDWCKGKVGREHELGITLGSYPWCLRDGGCRWLARWSLREETWTAQWVCAHHESCSRCGKVFREPWDLAAAECPAFTEDGHAEAAAEAARIGARSALRPRARRRVIDGPQGYRRKRPAS